MLHKKSAQSPYYPALDGIRGLAILFVVGFHNFSFMPFFEYGWLGVDLFFVLSGFLITNILIKAVGEKNYLKNFYLKRALRIFPLYYGVLFFCFCFLSHFSSLRDNLEYYLEHQFWLWTYFQNWLYILEPPETSHFLVHFWSLAVEEQ
ncbi:MAG TPA: acyltransferase, partial [Flavisolibacter sp.]|nr:acyltransferase [Flavisolibacter sp.]